MWPWPRRPGVCLRFAWLVEFACRNSTLKNNVCCKPREPPTRKLFYSLPAPRDSRRAGRVYRFSFFAVAANVSCGRLIAMRSTWRDRDRVLRQFFYSPIISRLYFYVKMLFLSMWRDFQKELVDGETTKDRLARALIEQHTEYRPLPGFDMNRDSEEYYRMQQDINCDEVYPGIFIGDGFTAMNKDYLKRLGITHVLNAAEGARFGCVNTNQNYYKGTNIKYLGLQLTDLPTTDISKYFYTAAAFIDDAMHSRGKIFVHCVMGVSRSATCVIAYLMIKKHLLAVEAIRKIRRNRAIHPNEGFLRQLAALDNQLRRARL